MTDAEGVAAAVAANEEVQIVDLHDHEIGTAPRWRMRAEHLVHRVTYIFVTDGAGSLYVHLRTPTKDVFPGYFDAAAGGVVRAGESYADSARREAAEELGIDGVALTPRGAVFYDDRDTRCWGRIFSCRYLGPFRLQPEEVVSGGFEPLDAVLDGRISPLTPDTVHALHALLAAHGGALP